MIHSNQRILRQLESENKPNLKKSEETKKQKKQTRSVRLKFWDNQKLLFLGLNQGIIETISKPEDMTHLVRNHFINVKDPISIIKYLTFSFDNNISDKRSIMTIQCSRSIWMVDIVKRHIIGGGKLDKRFAKNEEISSIFSIHDGRVLCVFTNQSNALLLLLRLSGKRIDLVFLDKSKLELDSITGQSQFGK